MRRRDTPKNIVIRKINPFNELRRIIGHGRDAKEVYDELLDYLKRRLIGKCASFSVLGRNRFDKPEIHGAGHWWIDDIYYDEEKVFHVVGHGFHRDVKDTYDVKLYLKDDIEYEDKIIYSPEDPWGEEDWENESIEFKNSKDPLGIKNHVIFYDGTMDAMEISEKLMELGYTFFEPDNIPHEANSRQWNAFSPPYILDFGRRRDYDYDFIISNGKHDVYKNYPKISSDEIHKMLNINIKKFKKIENPELDPLGEEDWGYEVVEEAYDWDSDEWWNTPDSKKNEIPVPVFQIGDVIEANGIVGMRTFRHEIGTVVRSQDGAVIRTDMTKDNYNDKKDSRYYSGTVYRIDFGNGDLHWISPWNMTLKKKEEQPKIRWYKKGHLQEKKRT